MPTHVQVSPEEELSGLEAQSPTSAPPPSPAPPRSPAPYDFGGPTGKTLIPDDDDPPAPARVDPARTPPASPASPPPLPPRASPPPLPPRATEAASPEAAPGRLPAAPRAPAGGAPNPALVAVASFFLPGLGQILVGQGAKGLVILVLAVFTCGGLGLLNILGAVDGFLVASRKQRGEELGPWQFF